VRKACVEPRELRHADSGLQVCQLEIEPDARVHVVAAGAAHGPALILQLPQPDGQRLVVRHDEAPLSRRDGFVRGE
jgi:hypothetical protein